MTEKRTAPTVVELARTVAERLRHRQGLQDALRQGNLKPWSSETLTQWLTDVALDGLGPFESAVGLAQKYADAPKYANDNARIEALIRYEASKSFTTGFLTSLPVPMALPAMLPVALVGTWLIQARLVGAMAILMGHNVSDLWVRTTVLLALDDAQTPRALRQAGLEVGEWASLGLAQHLAQPMVKRLWGKASDLLIKRAAQRGWTRVGRAVPLFGALVAGGLDAYGLRQVAGRARGLIVPIDRTLP